MTNREWLEYYWCHHCDKAHEYECTAQKKERVVGVSEYTGYSPYKEESKYFK